MKELEEILAKHAECSLDRIDDSEPIWMHQGTALEAMKEAVNFYLDKAAQTLEDRAKKSGHDKGVLCVDAKELILKLKL